MPTEYVKKVAKKTGTSVPATEDKWAKAKKAAAKEGHANDYAYIMGIFKRMAKASGSAPGESQDTRMEGTQDNGNGSGEVEDTNRGIIRTVQEHEMPNVTPQFFNSRHPDSEASVAKMKHIVTSAKARLEKAAKISPQWWIIERGGDQAGPYKNKEAAIKDGGKPNNIKFGYVNFRTGKFTPA